MDSVEDTAIVVADADRGGGRRLSRTVAAALITAARLGEPGHNGLTRQNVDA